MAVNKNFVVKNGLEVADDLIVAQSNKVGIASTEPSATLGVSGGIAAVDGLFVGIVTTQSRFEVGVGGTTLSADSDNGRIGINSATPRFQIDVVGSGGTSLYITNGGINATNAKIGGNITANSTGINVTGVVTATSFSGAGSGLSGVSTNFVSAVGIQSGGTTIGVGITQLNFIGVGNTFKTNGTTVDISIEGGGGAGVGTVIDYPSGLTSPFAYIDPNVTVTESMTLDDTNAGIDSSFIVVKEPTLLFDPGVTVTVGAGKTLVTDLFRLLDPPSQDLTPELTTISVSGVSTFVGLSTFNNGIIVVSGVSTFTDNIDANSSIDVAGDINVAGVVTATTFVGNVTGNLTGTASTATKVVVTADSTNTSQYVSFFSATSGNVSNLVDAGLTYNPFTNILTVSGSVAANVTGNVTGTASSATNSANIQVDVDNTTAANHYVVFSGSSSGYNRLNSDSTLLYNPSTNTLTSTTFSGSLSGNATSATTATTATSATTATTATNATNITLADESSDTTCFPVFATDATGNQAPKTDSSALTYNASTGTLAATNINSTSDVNLKTDIHNVEDAVTLINQIRGVKFRWRELDVPSVGVIAQEVEEVLPELISTRSDDGTKSVNYNGLVGVLIEAVKELSTRVEHLESQLNNK
jgi:hypothetical protein